MPKKSGIRETFEANDRINAVLRKLSKKELRQVADELEKKPKKKKG